MKLIKINTDHYVGVDDSEIKEGDWVIDSLGFRQITSYEGVKAVQDTEHIKKITHSTQPLYKNDFWAIQELKLSEVKELIGDMDVEKKANEYARLWVENDIPYYAFIQGYNQALEDNKEKKYTEMDMKKAFYKGIDSYMQNGDAIEVTIKDFRESLKPKTEWEVEFVNGKLKLNK